jgi:hypothetical protein
MEEQPMSIAVNPDWLRGLRRFNIHSPLPQDASGLFADGRHSTPLFSESVQQPRKAAIIEPR